MSSIKKRLALLFGSTRRRSFIAIAASENASIVILFVQSVLVSRVLGPAGIGDYSLLVAQLSLVGQVVCLGIPPAFLYCARLSPDTQSAYFWAAMRLLVLLSGTTIVVIIAAFSQTSFAPNSSVVVILVVAYIPFIALRPLFRNALNIEGSYGRLALTPLVAALTQTALVGWGAINGWLTVEFALLAFVAAAVARCLMSTPHMVRNRSKTISRPRQLERRLLVESWGHFGVSIAIAISTQLPIIFMEMLGSARSEIGYFSRALQIAGLVPIAVQSMMPLLFHHWIGHPMNIIRSNLMESLFLSSVLFVITTAIIFVLGEKLILLMYGSEFMAVYPPLLILQISALPIIFIRLVTQAMGSQGSQRSTIAAYGASGALVMILSSVLASWLGRADAVSMAMAVSGGTIAAALTLLVAFESRRRRDTSPNR